MNLNFKNHLISLLLHDDRLKDEQGELKGNLVKEFANTIDEKLITLFVLAYANLQSSVDAIPGAPFIHSGHLQASRGP